jgi:hypothetical protein
MNTAQLIADLKQELSRLNTAIVALEALDTTEQPKTRISGGTAFNPAEFETKPRKRKMSAAGRKRISEAAKKRWARQKAGK